MKTATVADLRNKFATVSKWIHDGETVTITKQGVPFAILAPIPGKKAPPPPVDRLARLRRLFPGGPVRGDVQAVIDCDRGQT
ncbi:MAG TPA: prevent-host-death protein [Verrucomicrobiota bacterium]|nr:prevent-host-death protein [Verrucomicrobiota bacterium]HNU51858.1 prevent-host-death protein [Verrucomicrobiota bacterium]